MRRWALACHAGLLLASSLLLAADDQEAARTDLSRLQGVWSFALVEVEGVRQPEAPFESHKLVISKGGRYTILQGPRITRGSLSLDPTKTPKHYDPTVTEGAGKGRAYRGIYELTGDSYRICLSFRNAERPTEFASRPGSGLLLFVFKREQTDVLPALVEIARLEMAGTWQAVLHALDGREATEADVKRIQLKVDAVGMTTALQGDKLSRAATTVDPAENPMAIDFSYTAGGFRGQTALGIYRVEDDRLTICRAAPGRARPATFASEPGSGDTLTTYEREKVP